MRQTASSIENRVEMYRQYIAGRTDGDKDAEITVYKSEAFPAGTWSDRNSRSCRSIPSASSRKNSFVRIKEQ